MTMSEYKDVMSELKEVRSDLAAVATKVALLEQSVGGWRKVAYLATAAALSSLAASFLK